MSAGSTFRIAIMAAVITAITVAACSSDSKKVGPDASTDGHLAIDSPMADAFPSTCGEPGDLGNELGIGKFCTGLGDCSGTAMAPLCSILGDPTTHFCTKICSSTGSAGQCGTATTCECNGTNQCGCTPNSCLN